jgi:AraC family transcriptional regulator
MAVAHDVSRRLHNTARQSSKGAPLILPGVEVMREGRVEPLLHARPTLSSAAVGWAGLVVEDYSIPACVIPRHEHIENFLHVVLRGSVKYEVLTRGKTLHLMRLLARPSSFREARSTS